MIGHPYELDVAGVKGNFLTAYNKAVESAVFNEICGAPIPSNQETETYQWLDELKAFGWWDGQPAIPEATLNKWKYTLSNRPYGSNWTVNDREVRYDKTGQINMRARSMGDALPQWINDETATVIEGATSGNLFDGVPMFSASHPCEAGGTVQSNLATTSPLTQTNVETGIKTMRKYKGFSGRRLGVNPTHLIVPVNKQFDGIRILKTVQAVGSADNDINPLYNLIKLIVHPGLTNDDDWYLADLSKQIRPIFMQESLKLRLVTQGPSDKADKYVQSRDYTFSADGELAIGKSLWFLIYKGDAA